MKFGSDRWLILLTVVLVASFSACTPKPAGTSPANDLPTQQSEADPQVLSLPTQTNAEAPGTVISCDQLIPPDEASSLMTGLSPKMTGQSVPGRITCTWQYSSKISGQTADFQLVAGYDPTAVEDWTAVRESELAGQPPDLIVTSIDGLGDENYTWIAKPDNQMVVYVRRNSQTLMMHYQATDILFMGTESGIIDMADRIFERMSR